MENKNIDQSTTKEEVKAPQAEKKFVTVYNTGTGGGVQFYQSPDGKMSTIYAQEKFTPTSEEEEAALKKLVAANPLQYLYVDASKADGTELNNNLEEQIKILKADFEEEKKKLLEESKKDKEKIAELEKSLKSEQEAHTKTKEELDKLKEATKEPIRVTVNAEKDSAEATATSKKPTK